MLDDLSRCDTETLGRPDNRRSYERSLSVALEQGPEGILEDAVALGSPWGFALGDVACPVDVWHGDEDLKVPPAAAARFARKLTLGEHLRLPGCGHFPGDREWAVVIDRLAGR
jgi:pimeloyl-ACP methyl ester carboxylesterase